MSYFSRLIQQTGIALGHKTLGFSGLEPSYGTRSDEGLEPLEAEAVQVAPLDERAPAESFERLDSGNRPIPPDSTAQPLTPHPSQEIPQLSFPPNQTIKPTILEQIEIQGVVEHDLPIDEPVSGEMPQPRESSFPPSLEPIEQDRQVEISAQSAASPKHQENPTPQVYVQMVREWVAQPPRTIEQSSLEYPQIEQVREISSEQTVIHQPSAIHELPTTQQRAINAVQRPIPIEQHEYTDSPDIQEFVLSIGSIQLTVETPQPPVQTPPVQPPSPQPARLPRTEGARLSRHYLRVR